MTEKSHDLSMSKKNGSDRVAYITESQQVAVHHWEEEENKMYCRAVVHILNLGNLCLGLCDMCQYLPESDCTFIHVY